MQYIKHEEPEGSFSKGFERTMREINEGLAQNLFQRRQRQDTALGLQGMGIDPMKAKLMAGLPEPILREATHREMLRPQEQLMSMVLGGMANGKTLQQAMQEAQEAMSGGQVSQGEQPQEQMQEMQAQQPRQQGPNLNEMFNQPGSSFPMMNQMLQQQMPQEQMPQEQMQQPQVQPQPRQPQRPQGRNPIVGLPLQQSMQLAQFEAQNKRQEALQREKIDARTQRNYEKWTPEFNKMAQRRQSNDNTLASLGNSMELVKSGKIIQGPVHAMLQMAHLDKIITTDETQLLEKMTQDSFNNEFRGFAGIVSRPSEKIFTEMGKAYANLNNKPLAMEGVIHTKMNEKKADNLIIDKTEEMSQAYQALGKTYPADLELQARNKVQGQIDDLLKDSNRFIKELVIRAAGGKIEEPTAMFDDKNFSKKDMKPGKAYVKEDGTILAINPDTGNIGKVEIVNGKAKFRN